MWNPAALIRWNLDKRYLTLLGGRGVEIVPTAWLMRGSKVDLPRLLNQHGWTQAVIKPTISASAHGTSTTDLHRAGQDQARLTEILRSGNVMIQPFLQEVQSQGEWSPVFFEGKFSHAVLKRPKPLDFRVQPDFGGTFQHQQPSARLLATAQSVVRALESECLYARVDGVEVNGSLWLMELELIEPELFLGVEAGAAERFASAIVNADARKRGQRRQ